MNARLDLLGSVSPSASSSPAGLCCPRYNAGVDAPPALAAELVSLAESAAVSLARALSRALRVAGETRL